MIEILSKDTIEKIAAGEVVERPLSVVKELVENAIDAGSDAISVELKGGGINYIRVTDNGCGIPADEVELAFVRHSTSKIKNAKDLLALNTLGFRGEALFSIAAISKVTLITATGEEMLGKKLVINGGNIEDNSECAAPKGSSFIVSDLFYNTPARLKFLKSPGTEGAAVEDLIEYLALSRPDISFRFISEGKDKIFTSGSGKLKNTIFEIFGAKSAGMLVEVCADTPEFKIEGFIGQGGLSRGNRKQEIFFVNGRYIRNTMLCKALEEACKGQVMQHRFPFCVLNLTFPEGSCDVNVHPSKMEVRFDDPNKIQKTLIAVLEDALLSKEDIVISDIKEESPVIKREIISKEEKEDVHIPEPFEKKRMQEIKEELIKAVAKDSPYSRQYKEKPVKEYDYEVSLEPVKRFIEETSKPRHKIIGQVFGTYWLIEFDDKLYLLDQHAAHEKVLYERTMELISSNTMHSQRLMPPELVSLSASEEDVLMRNWDSFIQAGFEIEPFGERDYRIVGVPASLPEVDFNAMFMDALNEGMRVNNNLITEKVASISCKAAVKGNYITSPMEAKALIDELFTLKDPYHCPHGRPTMISFTREDIDRRFKRIV